MKVWLSTEYTRAAPGGTGEAKCAGNYAAAFVAQAHATAQGCDQVVWLDAAEHRWVEEMGGMNLYFVYGSGRNARIVTPALTGTLLPGVTRDSLLTLAADLGYCVEEGKISTDEWQAGNASGAITEVFACGTAAVITPVGSVKSATRRVDGRRRPARPGLDAAARAAHRHPDRPAARHARLDARSDPPRRSRSALAALGPLTPRASSLARARRGRTEPLVAGAPRVDPPPLVPLGWVPALGGGQLVRSDGEGLYGRCYSPAPVRDGACSTLRRRAGEFSMASRVPHSR